MKEFERTKARMEQELSDVRTAGDISPMSVLMRSLTLRVYVW